VAEELQWQYRLIPVSTMDAVLGGLEEGRFDAAIGAITITPEREARVDFSYPAHRSGVAVALAKESGLAAFFASFSAAAEEFAGAIVWSWRCSSRSAFSSGGSNARGAVRGKRRMTR
jgi:ABC-type amino acid transport substrate-binding protein